MSRTINIKQTKSEKEIFTSKNKNLVDKLYSKRSTREELTTQFNLSDTILREKVAICSYFYPVISHSKIKGYKIACDDFEQMSLEELERTREEVQHALNETNSRIKCLQKKMKPLIAWLKDCEKYVDLKGMN